MDLQSARNFFLEKCVKISDEWLEQCFEFVLDEHFSGRPPPNLRTLYELLYEQWLLADLLEIAAPCLPNCISKANKFVLNGNFALQINSILDASRSAYSQHSKLIGAENENALVTAESFLDDEPKFWEKNGKRMLILELTDGVTNFRAMEYEQVRDLKPDLEPGCKILLQGRITCKRGMALLQNENVQILGGNVERLLTLNKQEALLKRKIDEAKNYRSGTTVNRRNNDRIQNLPPAIGRITPTVIDDERRNENNRNSSTITVTNTFPKVNSNFRGFPAEMFDSDEDFGVTVIPENRVNGYCSVTTSSKIVKRYDIPDDDDFPMGEQNYINRSSKIAKCYDIPDDDDDFFSKSPSNIAAGQNVLESPPTPPAGTLVVGSGRTDDVGGFETELHFDQSGGGGFFLKTSSRSGWQIFPPPTFKLTRIFDLAPKSQTSSVVKGTVVQIVQRLNVINNRWFCVVKISDGTGCLDCEICDQLLSRLLSMTSSEALAIRSSALQSPKQKAAQNVKSATNFLRNFDGLIHLELGPKLSLPVIQRFEIIDWQKAKLLKQFYYCNIKNAQL